MLRICADILVALHSGVVMASVSFCLAHLITLYDYVN